MKKIKVGHYQAFSQVPNEGNPAGVVFGAEELSVKEMQKIAQTVGFNETVFVLPSEKADYRLRYFTPGHEIDLCGHGTMAATYGICQNYGVQEGFHFETNVGQIKVEYHLATGKIKMEQTDAKFKPFTGNVKALCGALGIEVADLDDRYPIEYGNTGIWTLLLPIKNLASFKRMQPQNQLFAKILTEIPTASIHPFSLEAYGERVNLHGRHFSSSFSGTVEDPVTGTASGVMGAYYLKEIAKVPIVELAIEQGHEMSRPGEVSVMAKQLGNKIEVAISGVACFVEELEVEY
ncbi:PhzF family phenazine biosynthesis protein [Carnobacterium maltaromaticum]|uniref:PhzF family phenazine biosynthesis protein n=1 Tax=Carnobacterium maltaromaticum TaxID=2751 RepID=UPI00298A61BF|nr:PhzF family phenazine biosynthesis protein [Carnobacterium maltaromaticum]MDW5525352.1 PhzF family phenazine biosynthesis protein [Carnobacterium maltaromaticum]